MRFESLISRPHRLVIAAIVATCGALAPACLPDVDFAPASTDAGPTPVSDATTPPSDGSMRDAADASTDALPPADAADAAPEADPNAFGPFAENQNDDYDKTSICAVRGGALYCWGAAASNYYGLTGLPASPDASYPVPTLVPSTPDTPSHLTQLAMGDDHTCAVYAGQTYCYGNNDDNSLGDTDASTGASPVKVLGLPPTGVNLLAASEESTCAVVLDADAAAGSNVYCWGRNGEGELARPYEAPALNAAQVVPVLSDVTAIAGGGSHFCAISTSRGVLCWGANSYFQSGPTQAPADAGTCPGGNEFSCTFTPVAVPLPETDAGTPEIPVGVAAGVHHSCAVMQSGNVYCWGANDDAQLGVGDAGVPTTCPDITPTIQCAGTPQLVIGLPPIKLIRAGGYSSCALDTMNQAWCWGYNNDGELGIGTTSASEPTPVNVLDQSTQHARLFRDLAVGIEGACGTSLDDDSLYCWGQGLLGTVPADASTPDPAETPTLVLF